MSRNARRMQTLGSLPRWRLLVVTTIVAVAASAVLGRALELQVVNRDFLRDQADARHLRTVSMPAHRGMVTDRNGEPLAISSPVYSAWAHPGELLEQSERLPALAAALERSPHELRAYLTARSGRQFVYLRRHLPPQVAEQVRALDVSGVSLQREYRRFYPAGEVTAQLLGVTDIDGHGLEGVERAFDEQLSGRNGAKQVLRDRLGRTVEEVELIREPRAGSEIRLAIDRRIQYLTYRGLKRAVTSYDAKGGAVVVLDIASGEVLALANQPSFNPHHRVGVAIESRRNRAVADAFEPGSVVKPFTVLAALRSGSVATGEELDTAPGTMRVGHHTVRDFRDYGQLDLTGVIRKSSNVGATMLALRTPPRQLWNTFQDFGFGAEVGIGISSERAGHLSPAPPRRDVGRATLSYGYGLTATPLQLARAYAALASDGVMRPVSLLTVDQPPKGYRVFDEHLVAQVRQMLESVVESGGTGTRAAVPGYRVAGKTGTARKSTPHGYSEDDHVALFVGFAPASRPRVVVAVVIDEPRGEAYMGGQVAAPVFSEVMAGALRILNVPPDDLPATPIIAARGTL